MALWEAVLLGVVQGIFMFFPVSSTGHLVLAALYRARFRYFAYYVWVLAIVILVADVPGF